MLELVANDVFIASEGPVMLSTSCGMAEGRGGTSPVRPAEDSPSSIGDAYGFSFWYAVSQLGVPR